MRVISGSARRLQLIAPDEKVRPTTDKYKETLFNILSDELVGSVVLDLFAGSGALGIEALSRGAKCAYFIDHYKDSIEMIKKNLEHTKLVEKAKVLQYDYIRALQRMSEEKLRFDLVFLDPPYEQGFEKESLQRIDEYGLTNPKGIIVVESSLSTVVEEVGSLRIYKEKRFKTNKFTFFEAVNEEDR